MSQTRAYGRSPSPDPPEINWLGLLQVGGVLLVACIVWEVHTIHTTRQQQWAEVEIWFTDHGLADYKDTIINAGIRNLEDVAHFQLPLDEHDEFKTLPPENYIKLQRAFQMHQDQVLMLQWLKDFGLEKYNDRLLAEGVRSLDALAHISDMKLQKVLGQVARVSDYNAVQKTLQDLQLLSPNFSQYVSNKGSFITRGTIMSGFMCAVFLSLLLVYKNLNSAFALFQSQQRHKRSLFDFVTGHYLAPQCCGIDWENWSDNHVVGHTLSFNILFNQWNGSAYPVSNSDNILVEICHGATIVTPTVEIAGVDPQHVNRVRVTFTVHRAGKYRFTVSVAGKHINSSPFEKTFIPGPMDPQKSQFVSQGSVVVGCQERMMHLYIEPRDSYENICDYSSDDELSLKDLFQTVITETERQAPCEPAVRYFRYQRSTRQISLNLTLDQPGCYHVLVTYNGTQLKNSEFHVILLNQQELHTVEKVASKRSHNVNFEARLLSTHYHSPSDKGKKIYCYISPKQLTIKEFHFKIIPKKLNAFRVCPSTRFQFLGIHNQLETPILSIEDGCQAPVLLASKDRNLIAATFSKLLMKNIGGSETFKDKQDFFYHEVRQLHSKRIHDRLTVKINREKLLETSFKATKHFSSSDWCKNFEIIFQNEQGLDWGGVRREWFEIVSTELFDPNRSGLFCRFKEDDPQALVHPNPHRPATLKLKYYDFAGKIVGKCLYESSLGGGYRQQVKAKFSRSFLAQLIGLRVNYKYFESDDPDLYTSKIRYIEDNEVDDLDLTFIEEEFSQGQVEKVVELIPGGSKTPVTSSNKMKYLDALAQYKLANRVQEEIDAFLKGLNDLIPDNLLSIFDENELELLMCGTGNYSISDLQKHHTTSGSSPEFSKVLQWFWTIVSGYTQEEMARLLQFTTGCSQLPSGGFSQLTPNFQILGAPTYKVLPTAHTCFNQLCLPDYDILDELQQALHLAITEGNQGFGMI